MTVVSSRELHRMNAKLGRPQRPRVVVGRCGRPVVFPHLVIFGACREVVGPVALRVLRPSDSCLDVDAECVRDDRRRQVGRELDERAVVRGPGMDSCFVEVSPQGGTR